MNQRMAGARHFWFLDCTSKVSTCAGFVTQNQNLGLVFFFMIQAFYGLLKRSMAYLSKKFFFSWFYFIQEIFLYSGREC